MARAACFAGARRRLRPGPPHRRRRGPGPLHPGYLSSWRKNGYPYDITHLRWNVHGRQRLSDEKVADVVRDWTPRTRAAPDHHHHHRRPSALRAPLPAKAARITAATILLTWEDGAASSALETAAKPRLAKRLCRPRPLGHPQTGAFPAAAFQEDGATCCSTASTPGARTTHQPARPSSSSTSGR